MPIEVILPVNNLVNNGLLFSGGTSEINTGRLDAFMTHEVGKQCKIVEAVEEVLCEAMAERVRIDYSGIDSVFLGKQFELLCAKPRAVILSPKRLRNKYPDSKSLSLSHTNASMRNVLGMYKRRSFPPLE